MGGDLSPQAGRGGARGPRIVIAMSGRSEHERTVLEHRFRSDIPQRCNHCDFTRSVRFAKIGGSDLPEIEMRAGDDDSTDFVHNEARGALAGRTKRPDR
jgi:hypothetical protein